MFKLGPERDTGGTQGPQNWTGCGPPGPTASADYDNDSCRSGGITACSAPLPCQGYELPLGLDTGSNICEGDVRGWGWGGANVLDSAGHRAPQLGRASRRGHRAAGTVRRQRRRRRANNATDRRRARRPACCVTDTDRHRSAHHYKRNIHRPLCATGSSRKCAPSLGPPCVCARACSPDNFRTKRPLWSR